MAASADRVAEAEKRKGEASSNAEEMQTALAHLDAQVEDSATCSPIDQSTIAHKRKQLRCQMKLEQEEQYREPNQLDAAQVAYLEVDKELKAARGPFMQDLQARLDKLSFKRCAYHGGALLGNDVHTLMQPQPSHFILKSLYQIDSDFRWQATTVWKLSGNAESHNSFQ